MVAAAWSLQPREEQRPEAEGEGLRQGGWEGTVKPEWLAGEATCRMGTAVWAEASACAETTAGPPSTCVGLDEAERGRRDRPGGLRSGARPSEDPVGHQKS